MAQSPALAGGRNLNVQKDGAARYRQMIATPIPRLIPTLAVPTIITMLITGIYNMADTYFVSKLGTSATGAVGIVFSLMTIIQTVGFTFGVGAGSYISRLLGQRDPEQANRTLATAFFTAIACGFLITVGGLALIDSLMRVLGATPTILPYARDYAQYILLGAPIMAASFVMNVALRSEGSAFLAMLGIGTGAVLNIALDPIFIFGLDMGISGAAVATVLSQTVSFTILLSHFLRGRCSLRLKIRKFTFRWTMYREILKIGMPTFFRMGMASVAMIFLNTFAGPYGDAAIAGMSIVSRIMMFVIMALIGYGQGFQPVAGYNWGAKRYDRLWQAFWFSVKVGTIALSLIGLVVFIFAPDIIAVFRRNDPSVIAIGSLALRMQCVMLPFQVCIIMANMLFQSIGMGSRAAILALARQGLCFMPVIVVLSQVLGLLGIQMSQPTADFMTFLITVPLTAGFLKKLRIMKDTMPPPEDPVVTSSRPLPETADD